MLLSSVFLSITFKLYQIHLNLPNDYFKHIGQFTRFWCSVYYFGKLSGGEIWSPPSYFS